MVLLVVVTLLVVLLTLTAAAAPLLMLQPPTDDNHRKQHSNDHCEAVTRTSDQQNLVPSTPAPGGDTLVAVCGVGKCGTCSEGRTTRTTATQQDRSADVADFAGTITSPGLVCVHPHQGQKELQHREVSGTAVTERG